MNVAITRAKRFLGYLFSFYAKFLWTFSLYLKLKLYTKFHTEFLYKIYPHKRLCILIGESTTFKYEEDYETLITSLKSSNRLIRMAKFNNIFGSSIQPNDEHKSLQREEERYSRFERGLL